MPTRRLLATLELLVLSLWFGAGVFLILAAQAAFGTAGSPASAAAVVGAMLSRWHYIALGAPLLLLLVEWRGRALAGTARVVLLALALLAASGQAGVDLKIHAIRAASPAAISELSRSHPVRRTFGMLHGISMALLALQVLLAGAVVATGQASVRREIDRPSMS